MNARAKSLLTHFILYTLLFSSIGIGLCFVFIPVLRGVLGDAVFGNALATDSMLVISSLPSVMAVSLACAGAMAFSGYGHGSQESNEDYSFFGAALSWIILFALGVSLLAAFAIPAIHANMVYERNRIHTAQEEPQEEAPIAVLRNGIRLYYDTRFEDALTQLDAFLKYTPQNNIASWYRKRSADEYAHQQNMRAHPERRNQTALFKRGYDFLLDGNYLLAIMEFENVLEVNTNHSLARQNLEIAQQKLQEMLSKDPGETTAGDGLRAHLIAYASEGIEHYETSRWYGCLKIMEEILLLDESNATAIKYAQMARDEIVKVDFLDEEVRALAFHPAYRNILIPVHNGGLLYAKRGSFFEGHIWLSDFWIMHPRVGERTMQAQTNAASAAEEESAAIEIQLVGGDMAKMYENTLIIRGARIAQFPADAPLRPYTVRREEKYSTPLIIDYPLAVCAALTYSEKIDLDPITILRHHEKLYQLGWPDLPLWQTFNRQATLPFTIFMLGSVAAGWGWRFRKRHLHKRNPLHVPLAFPILLAIAILLYTASIRLLDSLNALFGALNIIGWVLAPIWAAVLLFATFFLLSRILRNTR